MSSTNTQGLVPRHEQLLRDSAIASEVAAEREYRTVTSKTELRRLGFGDLQCRVPALLIPIRGVDGEIGTYQIRPDQPRISKHRKAVKYETPKGSRMMLDVPPRARAHLADPARPLFITEGARKADAGVSKGLCTVALLGVWNWRGTNENGGKVALSDWDSVHLKGRRVYIVFDSDVMTKAPVHQALSRLKGFLEGRGARVEVIYLPSGDGGTKVGLDDFLAGGGSVDDLLALAEADLRPSPQHAGASDAPYLTRDGSTYWKKPLREGSITVELANFTASILADVTRDDGVESQRDYQIVAQVGRRRILHAVPARSFGGLTWVQELGADAILAAGNGIRDHMRVAIQRLSTDIERRTVYTHTGWRRIEDRWCYLHAGGAIGPQGPEKNTLVELPAPLSRAVLPDPPEGDVLVEAGRKAIELLNLTPPHVGAPLFASVFRTALGSPDFGLHLYGASGGFKTEIAALHQAFWGPGFDARHLPASWSCTANFLEALVFVAQDMGVVVDDFAPHGSSQDVQRYHRDADRLFRAQGNRSGRGRMTAEGNLRSPKPPRGMVFSTGEEIPAGHSLRARVVVLELVKGQVLDGDLSRCQADARDGAYPATMAGFVRWVADRYEQTTSRLRSRAIELRDQAVNEWGHRRTVSNLAQLMAGLEVFLAFAEDVGIVDETEAAALRGRCWDGLREAADKQEKHVRAADPVTLFLDLIRAALASGAAHLAAADGALPDHPVAAGWRERASSGGEPVYHEQGVRIGWIQAEDVYLEPKAAHQVAQRIASEGERLGISPDTLGSRLSQAGMLKSEDKKRGKRVVRRTLQGTRKRVLHLDYPLLLGGAHRAQDGPPDPASGGDGPETWAPEGTPVRNSGPGLGPCNGPGGPLFTGHGPDGPQIQRGEGQEDATPSEEEVRQWRA